MELIKFIDGVLRVEFVELLLVLTDWCFPTWRIQRGIRVELRARTYCTVSWLQCITAQYVLQDNCPTNFGLQRSHGRTKRILLNAVRTTADHLSSTILT